MTSSSMESRNSFSVWKTEINTLHSNVTDWNTHEKLFTKAENTYGYKPATEETLPCFSL